MRSSSISNKGTGRGGATAWAGEKQKHEYGYRSNSSTVRAPPATWEKQRRKHGQNSTEVQVREWVVEKQQDGLSSTSSTLLRAGAPGLSVTCGRRADEGPWRRRRVRDRSRTGSRRRSSWTAAVDLFVDGGSGSVRGRWRGSRSWKAAANGTAGRRRTLAKRGGRRWNQGYVCKSYKIRRIVLQNHHYTVFRTIFSGRREYMFIRRTIASLPFTEL